jgi:hypothetical protein
MPRLPTPIIKAQNKLKRVEFEPETSRYFLKDEVTQERIEICGELQPDGQRCIEPKERGLCVHMLKSEVVTCSSDVTRILEQVLDKTDGESKSDLKECLSLARSITGDQLRTLDYDIQLAYAFMYYHVKNQNGVLETKDIAFIMAILRDIVKAKEIQSRMEKSTKLDDNSVTEFVIEIFSVLRTELRKDDYTKIVQAIYDRVILPRQAAKVIGSNVRVITDAEVVETLIDDRN